MDVMFTIVPLFIGIVFVVVILSLVTRALRGAAEWNYNNSQPVASSAATVVAKRHQVSGSREHSSTTYFVTFELPGATRQEFKMGGQEFGLLAEGDSGLLQHQGSRYLGFERKPGAEAAEPPAAGASETERRVCEYCGAAIPAESLRCGSCGWAYRPKRPEGDPA